MERNKYQFWIPLFSTKKRYFIYVYSVTKKFRTHLKRFLFLEYDKRKGVSNVR